VNLFGRGKTTAPAEAGTAFAAEAAQEKLGEIRRKKDLARKAPRREKVLHPSPRENRELSHVKKDAQAQSRSDKKRGRRGKRPQERHQLGKKKARVREASRKGHESALDHRGRDS